MHERRLCSKHTVYSRKIKQKPLHNKQIKTLLSGFLSHTVTGLIHQVR